MSDQFDPDLARPLVGKAVLVGITDVDAEGIELGRRQFHGRIIEIDPRKGVTIQLAGSEGTYTLPPDFRAYRAADPGIYELRSTGELVEDPDLLATWIVTKRPDA
jgi:hypothetical protein